MLKVFELMARIFSTIMISFRFLNPSVVQANKMGTSRSFKNLAWKPVKGGMELMQNTEKSVKLNSRLADQINLKGSNNNEHSLAIMLCWLRAKPEHVMKYSQFYLSQGFDVLAVRVTPWQLLWPQSGSKVVASNILNFLTENDQYRCNVIHGFSVGGYLWGEVLDLMEQNRGLYQPVADRIVAQIWDSVSVMTFEKYKTRFPESVFPDQPLFRKLLESYVKLHTELFYNVATRHYLNSLDRFHSNNIVRCPALFFCSKDDPFLCVDDIQRAVIQWEKNGIDVHLQAWDSSPHVSHLKHHPEEYQSLLKSFLERLHLVPYPDKFYVEDTPKIRARL